MKLGQRIDFRKASASPTRVGQASRLLPKILATGAALVFATLGTPLFAQTNFAVLATDGAWTWYNDPRALFHQGTLYFGYVRASDGSSTLSTFKLQTGQKTDLWTGTRTQFDDHNVPGLLVKQDATMLAIYARHGTDQFFAYRLSNSTNPVAPADWGAEQTNAPTGAGVTYANPFQLTTESGRVYNFTRDLNFNPTVLTSTNGGSTWSAPQLFIQTGSGGSIRPYVKYCSDYTQRIDFLYTDGHPRDVANSLYHLYYQAGAFYKTDGTFVTNFSALPILHDSGVRGSVIYQFSAAAQSDPNQWIPTGRAWNWEIAYQSNGAPVCAFTVQRDNVTGPINGTDDRIYYYYGRWTGTNWQKRFIAHAGRPLYPAEDDYAGGICIDPQDPNLVYFSSNAQNPFNLSDTTNVPLRANSRYELWRGVTADGGLTFSWQQITTNSTVDNLRPYVPRRNGGEPCVLWFRGTYTTYSSYNCAIVGLFTTAVPQGPVSASGTWNTNASGNWSYSSNWLNGIVADGAANTADFSTLNITADCAVTLDSARTIGTLRFGDTAGGQNWTLNSSNGSGLTLNSGAPTIVVNQNTATLAASLAGTGGFTKSGPGTLILTATNSLSGTLRLDTGSTSANDGAVRLTTSASVASIASPIFLSNNTGGAAGSTLELDGSSGSLTVAQVFRLSCRNNAIPWVRNLAGTNTLSGGVSYLEGGNRNTFQSDAGMLNIGGAIQFQPNGAFTAARTNTFTGTGDFLVNGPILAATNGAPVHVVKSGPGRLTLNGANTYAGTTVVSNGALRVNGSIGTGLVTVLGGALEGNGVVAGSVIVFADGILSPGSSIGSLTINGSLTNSGTLLMELNKAGSTLTNDAIAGLNTLAAGGTLQLVPTGDPLAPGDSFHLFNAATYTGAFANLIPSSPGPGRGWDTSTLTVDGILRVKSVAPPVITFITLDVPNLVFGGSNGMAGAQYYVLSSTNVTTPLANWIRTLTNIFEAGGLFSVTNQVSAGVPQMFFVIQSQ